MPTGNRNYPTITTADDPDIPTDMNALATAIDADVETIARLRRFKVRRSVAGTIATVSWNKVFYDQIDTGYTNPGGVLTPAPADFVFPAGWDGRWNIYLIGKYDGNTSGARSLHVTKNGTGVSGGSPTGTAFEFGTNTIRAPESSGGLQASMFVHIPDEVFVAGDKLQVYTWQNSGANRSFFYTMMGQLIRTS